MAYDRWFDSDHGDRIIWGTTPEGDMTRIYICKNPKGEHFNHMSCDGIGVIYKVATEEEVKIFVQGYYYGVQCGEILGRQHFKKELKELIS